jgi:hypothetical protein
MSSSFMREPFTHAEAIYARCGAHESGFFQVTVQGEAPKFGFGFQLRQDANFAGGLIVEVMGWTGPLVEPPELIPYSVTDRFDDMSLNGVVVIGMNKTEVIPVSHVKEVPFTTDEEFMKLVSSS